MRSRRYVAVGFVLSLVVALFWLTSVVLLAQPLAGSGAVDVPSSAANLVPPQLVTQTWVLWLASPDLSHMDDWTLRAEAYHTVRLTQQAAVERRLSALKAQGVIVDFAGAVSGAAFTVTVADGAPRALFAWPEVTRVTGMDGFAPNAFAAEVERRPDAAPLSPSQATTLTLNLGIHTHLVSGVTPDPAPIALRLLRDSVELATATATPLPDGAGGYVYAVALESAHHAAGSCNPTVRPGDVLEAVQGGQVVTLTVPALTALADETTATVYGQSPPEAALDVYAYRYSDNTVVYRQTVTATVGGAYEADFAALTPFAPRDYGYVFFPTGNHRVYARFNVPLVSVGISGNRVTGFVAPCGDVDIDLYDAQLTPIRSTFTGYASGDGAFLIYLYPFPRVGDTVVVSAAGQTISVTLFDITVHPVPDHDIITGTTPASATVQVDVYRGPIGSGYYYEGCYPQGELESSVVTTAAISGVYTADFAGQLDLVAGHFGAVYAIASPGGQVYRCFAVPFLRVSLGEYRVAGQVSGGGSVTVSVWGSSGALRDVHQLTAYSNGSFYDWGRGGGNLHLLAGDWVTVTGPDGVDTGMHVPTLTVHTDRAHSLVYGEALPGSRLRVGVYLYTPKKPDLAGGGLPPETTWSHTLWVTATASGVYTADFSALTAFEGYGYGEVTYLDAQGHEAYREFSLPHSGPPIKVQSGSNCVEGYVSLGSYGQVSVYVTLRGADGQVRATGTTRSYGGYFVVYLYTADWQPAIIGPGDTVEVTTGDDAFPPTPPPTMTPWPTVTPVHVSGAAHERALTLLDAESVVVTVPTLTIQADFAADVVYGEAPPDSVLWLTWSDNDTGDPWYADMWHWAVTSTLTGTYHLDAGPHVDLDPAGKFTLSWTDVNGNEVWRQYQPPYLSAVLGERRVTAYGDVYHTVALTVADASGIDLYTQTASFDRRAWATFYLQQGFTPLLLEPGYVLKADWGDTVRELTLPQITALVDMDADVISGKGPPGEQLLVDVYAHSGTWRGMPVTVTAAGTYTLDLSGTVDLTAGSGGQVVYRHPDGHRVARRFGIPIFEVWLGEAYVQGHSYGTWGSPLTVSLYSTAGYFKGRSVVEAGEGGSFTAYLKDDSGAPVTVSGSDRIVVEAVGNPAFTYTVPVLTAVYDADTHVLSGVAPANAWLEVAFDRYVRRVPANAAGAYAVDWRDVAPRRGTQGTVHYNDAYGNRTSLRFEVPWLRVYLPLLLRAP